MHTYQKTAQRSQRLRQEGRMGLSTQRMMRLASFTKSTLVGAVHISERGRRLRLTQKTVPEPLSHTWTPTGLWLSQRQATRLGIPQPPTLTDSLQVGVSKGSQGQAGGGGGRIASTGGEGNLHRQSGPVTVTSGGWRWE
ncbi:hypothetical protein BY996DRAFT_6416453 [Phakopsora pachyrhizi]|nr:hypothetical protein BY996DRAFT_6416453 [Phakopsora pachyrhizi]